MEDFWECVDKTDTCWLWSGTMFSDGYGRYKNLKAHRVSLELHLGRPITPGLMVAHTPLICHNKRCVNPSHLSEKTAKDNMLDRTIDGTDNRGERNSHCKLTREDVLTIRKDTRLLKIIAEEYEISISACSDIKTRRSWRWLPE